MSVSIVSLEFFVELAFYVSEHFVAETFDE